MMRAPVTFPQKPLYGLYSQATRVGFGTDTRRPQRLSFDDKGRFILAINGPERTENAESDHFEDWGMRMAMSFDAVCHGTDTSSLGFKPLFTLSEKDTQRIRRYLKAKDPSTNDSGLTKLFRIGYEHAQLGQLQQNRIRLPLFTGRLRQLFDELSGQVSSLYKQRREATHRRNSGEPGAKFVPMPSSEWSAATQEHVRSIDSDLQAFQRKLDQLYQVNSSGVIHLTLATQQATTPIIQFKRPAKQRRRR